MSEELAEIIREEIRQKGPIPFSRWMELCLYHPQYGYYMKPGRKTGYGRDADFVTPPTLHPFFGVAIAKEIQDTWRRLGRPDDFRVLEWGGGEGDLGRIAVSWLDEHQPELATNMEWVHIEYSPTHRTMQHRGADSRFRWLESKDLETGWGRTSTPDHTPRNPFHFTVLCEVLDAVGFDVFEHTHAGWAIVKVQIAGLGFHEKLAPVEQKTLDPEEYVLHNAWRLQSGLHRVVTTPGQRVVDFHGAMNLLEKAWDATRGTVFVADYMEHPERLWLKERPAGTVRAYRNHGLVSPLESPGEVDITATVDIVQSSLKVRGNVIPDSDESLETLEQFLLRHGILDELNAIDRNTVEGASSYLRLRQLLLPTGMGAAFKVQRFHRIEVKKESVPSVQSVAGAESSAGPEP